MASTSQAATHSPAFHSTIHGYSINPSGGILTPRAAPAADTTGPRSGFITLVVNDDIFDEDKDHKVDNGGDRSGNDAACAPRECTTAEALAACELLQPVILEDRKPIEVATVSERNQVDCIIEQDKVPDNSGHGKSIETTSIHDDDQQPESQSSANTPMSLDGLPSELYCNCCQKNWKNKSELKKHLNRRSKPFRCNREECTKNQVGFASNPDLTRHKRTVHGDNLKGKTYICTNGVGVHKIEQVSDIDLQHYSASAESVADGEQFVALDDDTENEKGEHLNGLARAKQLELLALVPATVLQEALRQKGGKVCNICGRVFTRPCELRKHSKRHKKPYGCTVYRCEKTFGSKDDWKRHERQQHTPPEVWVCEKNCREAFGSRDLFGLHLEDSHHEMSPL
uniref:C2H2-type domain-containing protein n=1 Tax=Bionectria ochroleuca TaxID=29856 RepID=A0A8H7TR37_BIOOC